MTKAGVKLSITSIVSIVSTQVAPRLHHAHKKEGQFDTFYRAFEGIFFTFFRTFDENMMVRERGPSKPQSHLPMGNPQLRAYESPDLIKTPYTPYVASFINFVPIHPDMAVR